MSSAHRSKPENVERLAVEEGFDGGFDEGFDGGFDGGFEGRADRDGLGFVQSELSSGYFARPKRRGCRARR